MSQKKLKKQRPAQHQNKQPGVEEKMQPRPHSTAPHYQGSDKLKDKVALITGGDSGIGRAVSILFAREGADLAIVYLNEKADARATKRFVELEGRKCILIQGDVSNEKVCKKAVEKTVRQFGKLDILINNAAVQFPQKTIEDITAEQLEYTFRTNIFSYFFMTKAAAKYFKKGGIIINTASVTAYRGSPHLLDYSATKGAIVAFTRSLSGMMLERGIRVNGVAPGPVWTPLIPSSFRKEEVATFGSNAPMQRAGQPEEIAPAYVFLASDDSSYMTGQILHPNGGEIING